TTVSHVYTTNQVMNNAASADFGISYFGDQVVFSSTRNQERPIYPWNKRPMLDLYTADVDDEGQLTNIVLFPGEINTDTHESSATRSEEHTSELQSRENLVCRLLLEKKKHTLPRGHQRTALGRTRLTHRH